MGDQAADQSMSMSEHRLEFRSALKQSMCDIFRMYQEQVGGMHSSVKVLFSSTVECHCWYLQIL